MESSGYEEHILSEYEHENRQLRSRVARLEEAGGKYLTALEAYMPSAIRVLGPSQQAHTLRYAEGEFRRALEEK